MSDKKPTYHLADNIIGMASNIVEKKISKAQYDKSYTCTILGANRDFTDDVSETKQNELIKQFAIPEVQDKENYYTVNINGVYHCIKSNNNFKLYQSVRVIVPQGDWSKLYIEGEADGVQLSAGTGIEINDSTISAKPATYGSGYTKNTALGAVYVNGLDCGLEIGKPGDFDEGGISLCTARRDKFGGLTVSDGLENHYGTTDVSVRLGRGLQFVKNDTTKEGYYDKPVSGDGLLVGQSEYELDHRYRGRAIEPLLGKGMELGDIVDSNRVIIGEGIQPRLGAGLKFEQYYKYDENGKLVPGDWFIEPNLGKNLSTDRYGKINAKTPSFYTGSFLYTVSGTLYFYNVGVFQEKPIAVFIYCGELFNGIRNNQVWFGYPDMGTVMTDSPGAKYIIIGEQPTGGWLVRFCPQQETETSKGMTFHYFIICEAG